MDRDYLLVLIRCVSRIPEAMRILDEAQVADDDLGDIYLGDEIRRAVNENEA